MKRWLAFALAALLLHGAAGVNRPAASSQPVPRTIVVFYDRNEGETPRYTRVHGFMEMPLNHLGYVVRYYDANQPLPELTDDVHGVLLAFAPGYGVENPAAMLDWAIDALDRGRKVVIFGHSGVSSEYRMTDAGMKKYNALMNRIGFNDTNEWVPVTYRTEILMQNPMMMGFERALDNNLPPYMRVNVTAADAVSHMRLVEGGNRALVSDQVIVTPRGGYVADGYGIYLHDRENDVRQWHVNPFLFFGAAFGAEDLPKPDVSTLMGRRLFYAHIDGDGWNNLTEVDPYRAKGHIAADVIRREIFDRYPQVPYSVGIIVSEVDPACYGLPESERVAREILALPQIEPSSHTHSHPLYWEFFEQGSRAEEEVLILGKYPPKPEVEHGFIMKLYRRFFKESAIPEGWREWVRKAGVAQDKIKSDHDILLDEALEKYFGIPRSYACAPFDLRQEIFGSLESIRKLSPPGKQVKLIQWSGNTSPFEQAIRLTREAGARNINGGDSRYDPEYPSYSWVSSVGLQVGGERQIYSSNSNENTYTYHWKERYFGFKYLIHTLENTESPMRIKGANIYFHMFSGEKLAGLNAVKANMEYVLNHPLIYIFASDYAAIGDGFYTTEFHPLGERIWQIKRRDGVQTIRFDNASLKAVDFGRSQGVIGQRHYQGSLYVALDPAAAEPVLALTDNHTPHRLPDSAVPYLVESSAMLEGVTATADALSYQVKGFGKTVQTWKMPASGKYAITVTKNKQTVVNSTVSAGNGNTITLEVDTSGGEPAGVTLTLVREE